MNRVAVFALIAPTEGFEAARRVRRGWGNAQRLLIRVWDTLSDWQERAAQRRQLAGLDDRLLADIGCGRGEAIAESLKPFWRP